MNNYDNFFNNLLPLRPLFPFVQSVLPTVFDDSLSYLETLGKVVKALNDTESNVNTLEDAVRAFADDLAAFENLTIYPVNMTFNENTGNYSADKTFADIDAALLEGRTPVLHVLDRDGRNYYSAQLAKAGNTVFYWTTPLFYENGNSVIFRAFINSSDVSGVITSPIDNAVIVNYTTVSGSDIPVVDKTFEQISAALEDNNPVFLFVDGVYWIPLVRANRTGNDVDGYHYISADFIYTIPVSTTGGNNLGVGVYSVNSSDVWSVNRYAFPDTGRVNTLIDNKLAQHNAVLYTVQDLDANEKLQARVNISAGSTSVAYDDEMGALVITDETTGQLETIFIGGGGNPNAVLYIQQALTNSQKVQARANIGAGISTVSYNESTGMLEIINGMTGAVVAYHITIDSVRYGEQTLTEAQKAQARANIGAVADAVQYIVQALTEAQKLQARANIGAGTTTTRVNAGDGTITLTDPYIGTGNPLTYQYKTVFLITAVYSNGEYTFDRNQADILSAIVRGQLPVVRYHTTAGQSDYDVYHEWVFSYYTYDGEDVYIYFSRVDQQGNVSQMRWFGSTGKAVVITTATLPAATGADDGKIPMVNSFGNYQLVTPSASSGTPRVSMASTDTTPTLDANKFYVFPEMASLSVSLNAPASNAIVNEYHFRFTSGSTATQFDLPASVIIPDDFDVAANTVYEISIVDNYMVYSSWEVSTP